MDEPYKKVQLVDQLDKEFILEMHLTRRTLSDRIDSDLILRIRAGDYSHDIDVTTYEMLNDRKMNSKHDNKSIYKYGLKYIDYFESLNNFIEL